jgi:hypothetical protein
MPVTLRQKKIKKKERRQYTIHRTNTNCTPFSRKSFDQPLNEQILNERIDNLEADIQSLIKKQTLYFESEKTNRSKIEYLINQFRLEMNDKIKPSEGDPYKYTPQISGKIDSLQEAYSGIRNEINNIYSNLNTQKNSSEKYTILFNEVVRIGKNQEGQQQILSDINRIIDEKLKKVEMHNKKSEAEMGSLEALSNISTQLINQYAEKNDEKVKQTSLQLQSALVKIL